MRLGHGWTDDKFIFHINLETYMERRIVDSNITSGLTQTYIEGDCFRMKLTVAKSHSDLILKSPP